MKATHDWSLPSVRPADGIDQRWLQAFAAQRMADVLARVAIGERLFNLPPMDRAFFNRLAEATIERAVEHYARFKDEQP